MAFAFETIYGVPPGSGYSRMPFATSTLGADQPLLDSELLGYGRDPLQPIKDAVTVDGDIVVPIDARAWGFWLKAAFGAPATTSVAATGAIEFASNPAEGDTITLNGTVWTFVDETPGADETEIQGTLIQTLDQLVSDLNGSADTEVEKATYSRPSSTERLVISYDTAGTAGNDFTIAASAATVSGATLTGGGYSHQFNSGSWDIPSFAVELGMPEVPSYARFPGCKLDELSWTMQRSGMLTASARVIAQGELTDTESQAGQLEQIELRRFGHFQGSIERDGAALGNVVQCEITYMNNLDRIETIRGDGQIDGADPSLASLRGRMDVRFASTELLDQATAGESCELKFSYVLPSGEQFELVAHAVYLPRPRREIQGPQGVQVSFEWQAARDPSEGRMCTATLINDMEDYDAPA